MEIGIKKEKYFIVKETESAKNMGSGDLEVLATPILVAYFENVSKDLVTPYLTEGDTTVGINININHLAPSKIGNQILIKAELIEINKRILTFKLEAFDKDILIGEGTHKRCIVNINKFLGKLN